MRASDNPFIWWIIFRVHSIHFRDLFHESSSRIFSNININLDSINNFVSIIIPHIGDNYFSEEKMVPFGFIVNLFLWKNFIYPEIDVFGTIKDILEILDESTIAFSNSVQKIMIKIFTTWFLWTYPGNFNYIIKNIYIYKTRHSSKLADEIRR